MIGTTDAGGIARHDHGARMHDDRREDRRGDDETDDRRQWQAPTTPTADDRREDDRHRHQRHRQQLRQLYARDLSTAPARRPAGATILTAPARSHDAPAI